MTVTFEPSLNKMEAVIAGMPDNKSAKIRRLAVAGYKRADIARHLGVRYQFAYNVLAKPAPKGERAERRVLSGPVSALEGAGGFPARWVWVRVGPNGAMELPETFLSALAIGEGDQVQLQLEDGAVRLLTREAAMNALKSDIRKFVPEGVSLVDELIAERREEAAREVLSD